MQRFGAFVDDLDDVVDTQQVIGSAIGCECTRALNMFGDYVVGTVLFTGVIDRHDIRVLQHPDHVRLVEEHLA